MEIDTYKLLNIITSLSVKTLCPNRNTTNNYRKCYWPW